MLKEIIFSVAAKRAHPGLNRIKPVVNDFLATLTSVVLNTTNHKIVMQNGLADGGDMIVADLFLNLAKWPDPNLTLNGIFPFKKSDYLRTIDNQEHFKWLLSKCSKQVFLNGDYLEGKEINAIEARAKAYRSQASYLLKNCMFLLALADESDPLKAGGTMETVSIALNHEIPVIFLSLEVGTIFLIQSAKDFVNLTEKNNANWITEIPQICEHLLRLIISGI